MGTLLLILGGCTDTPIGFFNVIETAKGPEAQDDPSSGGNDSEEELTGGGTGAEESGGSGGRDSFDVGSGGETSIVVDCEDPENSELEECIEFVDLPTAMGGAGMGTPPDDCISPFDSRKVVRLQAVEDDYCLMRGEFTIIGPTFGYSTAFAPCADDVDQMWRLILGAGGLWQIRNENVNLNLDVLFADPSDGTQIVIFDRNEQFNQRFSEIVDDQGLVSFSPAHTQNQCLTRVDDQLETQPCQDEGVGQKFRKIDCHL